MKVEGPWPRDPLISPYQMCSRTLPRGGAKGAGDQRPGFRDPPTRCPQHGKAQGCHITAAGRTARTGVREGGVQHRARLFRGPVPSTEAAALRQAQAVAPIPVPKGRRGPGPGRCAPAAPCGGLRGGGPRLVGCGRPGARSPRLGNQSSQSFPPPRCSKRNSPGCVVDCALPGTPRP